MQKYIIIISVICIIFSCKPDKIHEPELPIYYMGEGSALKNGQPWTGYSKCFYLDDITDRIYIQIDSLYFNTYVEQQLTFEEVLLKEGSYPLSPEYRGQDSITSAVFSYWDEDQYLGEYKILGTGEPNMNYLTIESYDTLTKKIKGKFDLIMTVTKRPYAGAPDTLRLTNGQFFGKVYKR
jgi:hypothetical protein